MNCPTLDDFRYALPETGTVQRAVAVCQGALGWLTLRHVAGSALLLEASIERVEALAALVRSDPRSAAFEVRLLESQTPDAVRDALADQFAGHGLNPPDLVLLGPTLGFEGLLAALTLAAAPMALVLPERLSAVLIEILAEIPTETWAGHADALAPRVAGPGYGWLSCHFDPAMVNSEDRVKILKALRLRLRDARSRLSGQFADLATAIEDESFDRNVLARIIETLPLNPGREARALAAVRVLTGGATASPPHWTAILRPALETLHPALLREAFKAMEGEEPAPSWISTLAPALAEALRNTLVFKQQKALIASVVAAGNWEAVPGVIARAFTQMPAGITTDTRIQKQIDQALSAAQVALGAEKLLELLEAPEFGAVPDAERMRLTARLELAWLSEAAAGDGAAADAEALYALQPRPETALRLARCFAQAGVAAQALAWAERVPAGSEPATAARNLMATTLFGQGRWAESAAHWRQLHDDAQPGGERQRIEIFLARCAQRQGDLEQAGHWFGAVLAADPDHAEAAQALITMALQREDVAAAQALLERHGAALDRLRRVDLRVQLAEQRQPGTGLAEWEDELARAPQDIELLHGFGNWLSGRRQLDRAATIFRQLLELAPEHRSAAQRLLVVMNDMKMPLEVQRTQAEAFLQRHEDDVWFIIRLAGILLRANQASDAREMLARARAQHPDQASLWQLAAEAEIRLGLLGNAQELAMEFRARIESDDPGQLVQAAQTLFLAECQDEAVALIRSCIESEELKIADLRTAIGILIGTGHYGEAVPAIRRAEAVVGLIRPTDIALAAARVAAMRRACDRSCPDGPEGAKADDNMSGLYAALVFRAPPPDASCRSGIVHVTSGLGAGGAERQVTQAVTRLSELQKSGGEPVHLLAADLGTGRDFFLAELLAAGVPVSDLSMPDARAAIRNLLVEDYGHAETLRALMAFDTSIGDIAARLYAQFVRLRPRVVHLWQDTVNVAGGLAAVMAGVPVVILGTRSTRPRDPQRFRFWLEPGYRALLRRGSQIRMVNNSAAGARDYESWLNLRKGAIGLTPNSFDFKRMARQLPAGGRSTAREALGLGKAVPVIGGVMRLSPEKRPDLWVEAVIRAAQMRDDVHGILVGSGPMQEELQDKIQREGLEDRIRLLGRRRPVEPVMAAMDLMVLTSQTEGLPNVLIEAQGLGVPVLTLDVGGAAETLLPERTGLLVPDGPRAELAERLVQAILPLLEHPARLSRMGCAGARHVRHSFGTQAALRQLLNVYYTNGPSL